VTAIGELVWQVTIVDATIVRYYPDVYDAVLEALPAAEGQAVEGTMAGLRFVRNQMRGSGNPAGFFSSEAGEQAGPGARPAAVDWRWGPVAEPSQAGRPTRGPEWELKRYQAYQAFLVGRATGETFGQAAGFLRAVADAVSAETAVSQPAG
jgi:hypothetical protein